MTALPTSAAEAPGEVVARAVALSYAGRVFRFASADAELSLRIPPPQSAFCVPADMPASCEVMCRVGRVEPADGPVLYGPETGEWALRELPGGGQRVTFYRASDDPLEATLVDLATRDHFRHVRLVCAPRAVRGGAFTIGYPLDEYLAARVLGRGGAVILHAATVLFDGDALVFAGHSGAGKSTLSELAGAEGGLVLSDDRTILTSDADDVRAWGSPWHGTARHSLAASGPVRAVFLLEQASCDRAVSLPAARAFKELFVRLIRPTGHLAETVPALDTLQRLVDSVPVAALQFRPAPAALNAARAFAAK